MTSSETIARDPTASQCTTAMSATLASTRSPTAQRGGSQARRSVPAPRSREPRIQKKRAHPISVGATLPNTA